jgi:hypothetical protein
MEQGPLRYDSKTGPEDSNKPLGERFPSLLSVPIVVAKSLQKVATQWHRKRARPHPGQHKTVPPKTNFTKAALTSASSRRTAFYLYDARTRGLTLRVSPGGAKTFVLYRKIHGRPERINIGPFPDLTIEQARGKAAELNA